MATPVLRVKELLQSFDVIDLSPTLERGIPRWPTHPHLVIDPTVTHEHDGYYCQSLSMPEHVGAHVDAPAHVHPQRLEQTIDTFAPDCLIGRAVVYDVEGASPKPGDQLEADVLLDCEARTGAAVGQGDIALIHFGWMKRYWRTDRQAAWYATQSPGLAESAVRLLAERGVKAVGADNIACDQAVVNGVSKKAYGHEVYWLPRGILIMESLANLHLLPPECFFLAVPLKIRAGSGSPLRPLALVPKGGAETRK